MKVTKDKQFIVFEFDDGQTVKYDLSTQKTIGKRGKAVYSLQSQLQGYTVDEFIEDMKGTQFGGYAKWVQNNCYREPPKNVSSLLEKIKSLGDLEAVYNCGLIDNVSNVKEFMPYGSVTYPQKCLKFSDIPKGFLKVSRETGYKISTSNIRTYKENSDLFHQILLFDHPSYNDKQFILDILNHFTSVDYRFAPTSTLNHLIITYNCNPTSLLNYVGDICRYEALSPSYMLEILADEYKMLKVIHKGNTFDKYSKNLLTRHRITSEMYQRIKKEYDENLFKQRIDLDMEMDIEEYTFILPKTTQDIKDEAIAMHNCLSSYVDNVLDGSCSILFMRYKDKPDEALIDMEIRNGNCVQRYRKGNTYVTDRDLEVIRIWEEKYAKRVRERNKNFLNTVDLQDVV